MSRVHSWKEIPQYPVITGVALIAAGLTLAWWTGSNISALFANAEIRRGQVWRLFTSIFLHTDILHLVFNIYWLWILGTTVERLYGHFKTILLIVLLALGSGSLEFALAQGGVGLSGVGYGLFGFLYVLSQRDDRFKDALDKRTVNLFVGWFFLCIFLTVTHVFNVGNVAHGAGAILGLLLGYAITNPQRRKFFVAASAALVLLGLVGSTFARPYINLSSQGGYEEGKWGYDALIAGRNREALRWLQAAVRYQPKVSSYWFDLGIAYDRLNNHSAAMPCYERAYELEPNDSNYAEAAGKANANTPAGGR
jgi:membrane associated rhomboid family serine protease